MNTFTNVQSLNRAAVRHVELLTALARFGYAAKGVVYLVVGALALRVAFWGGEAKETHGAVAEIGRQPFGQIMLWILALGLACYAIWRIVEGIVDPEQTASGKKGPIVRIGRVATGIVHGSLAIYALQLALGVGADHDSPQSMTAELMSQAYGRVLVVLAGVVVLITAGVQFHHSYSEDFMKEFRARMGTLARRWVRRLGKAGLFARGVVFAIMGAFLLIAAWQSDPREAIGLDGVLEKLAQQPYGTLLLALVAAGLALYGIFQFMKARYKRFAV